MKQLFANQPASSSLPISVTLRVFLWLLFVLVCSIALEAKEPDIVVRGSPDPAPSRFESEIAAFEKWDRQNAVPRDPILFVGSSTIRLWQTADSFPGLPVINRGFGGSTIADVNHFADRIVFKYKPRLIVFYAGDNDIAGGRSPEQVFGDFQTFVNAVREHPGDTPIIYLAIKPSNARWKSWPQMQIVNARVKKLAQEDKHLTYVDTAPPILGPDGQPRAEFFRNDGLHLNEKGYAAWNEILAPILATNLGSELK
jgi:lysophospholipase L1-like esterase